MKKPLRKIGVSDHAVVRYLERVWELDIVKVKQEIVTPSIRQQIGKAGTNTGIFYGRTQKDFKAIIENGTVVTVI